MATNPLKETIALKGNAGEDKSLGYEIQIVKLDEIFQILEGLKNHPLGFDNKLIRQIIDCIIVESKTKSK